MHLDGTVPIIRSCTGCASFFAHAVLAPCPNNHHGRGAHNPISRGFEQNCSCQSPYFGGLRAKVVPSGMSSPWYLQPSGRNMYVQSWLRWLSCQVELCPGGCSSGGRGVTGTCTCDAGRVGSDCAGYLCPDACSGAGSCNETSGMHLRDWPLQSQLCCRAAEIQQLILRLVLFKVGLMSLCRSNFVPHIPVLCQFGAGGSNTSNLYKSTTVVCITSTRIEYIS